MKKLGLWVSFVLWGVLCLSCDPQGRTAPRAGFQGQISSDTLPLRRELYRVLWRADTQQVVYATGNPRDAAAYRETFLRLNERLDGPHFLLRPDSIATPVDFNGPSLLVGAARYFARLEAWRLPVEINANRFTFDGENYAHPSSLFSLHVYPNPQLPQAPMSALLGLDAATVLTHLNRRTRQVFWDAWGYEIYQDGQRIVMGEFDDQSQWRVDTARQFDLREQTASVASRYWRFRLHRAAPEKSKLRPILDSADATARRVDRFLSISDSIPPAQYHAYFSGEWKALLRNQADRAHLEESPLAAHVLHTAAYEGLASYVPAQVRLRQHLGTPAQPWVELGLAVWLTPGWGRSGWSPWASRLTSAGLLPDPASLAEFSQSESPLVRAVLAATRVDFLLKKHGRAAFLRRYRETEPFPLHDDAAWRTHLRGLSRHRVPSRAASIVRSLTPSVRGFNFAHEGYRVYNGYLSGRVSESVERMRALGANTAAIIPYTGTREINRPVPFRLVESAGSENDASVVNCIYRMRQSGIRPVLKPQVWISGSWPGDVAMRNTEDWEKFFAYYRNWILHYALLAEMHRVELFFLGVEFKQATLQHPEAWRTLIGQIREVYSGAMTYCANWGEEYEEISFWDAFDLISVSCYYPLHEAANPSEEELERAADGILRRVAAVGEKWNKPVLLGEIGFRSVTAPWRNPHAEAEDRAADPNAQARAYEAYLTHLPNYDRLIGALWWKWPAVLRDASRRGEGYEDYHARNFAPLGKPAEGKLRRAWRE